MRPGNKKGGCALLCCVPGLVGNLDNWIFIEVEKGERLKTQTRRADVCLAAHWSEDACWHCPSARLAMGLVSVIDIDFDFE